jgi:hypothetical protein
MGRWVKDGRWDEGPAAVGGALRFRLEAKEKKVEDPPFFWRVKSERIILNFCCLILNSKLKIQN